VQADHITPPRNSWTDVSYHSSHAGEYGSGAARVEARASGERDEEAKVVRARAMAALFASVLLGDDVGLQERLGIRIGVFTWRLVAQQI